jgi:hypothetical protein
MKINIHVCPLLPLPTIRPYLTGIDAFHMHLIHFRLILILSSHLGPG